MTNLIYENVKCPICDGPMISRKSQYGTFWGCKAFPNCKGTRDSMGRSKDERSREEGNDKRSYNTDRNDRETLDSLMEGVRTFSFKKVKE